MQATDQGTDRPVRAGPEVVVITGSSGFLASALIERLAGRYRLVGLDFALPSTPNPDIEAIRVDLTSDASVAAAFRRIAGAHGRRIASVVHLAGYYDLSGDPNPKYEQVTVQGTARLLRQLQELETEQLILASTMLVHAPTRPGRPIDEASPLQPKTPYPQSKLDAEELLRQRHGDLPVVLLRPAGIYDEQCRAAFLAQQIANIHERLLVSRVYPGDPESGQPCLHVDDFADAVARLIERRRELPAELPLLLGEPETMSYDELQSTIGRLLHGEDWETQQIPKVLAKVGQWLQEDVLDHDPFVQPWMIDQASDHYELDIGSARELLGWEPKHSLRQTLPAMIGNLRDDPPAWYAANKLNPATVAAADAVIEDAAAEMEGPTQGQLEALARDFEARRRRTLWAPLSNAAIGLWLMASPFAYGLFDPSGAPVPPALGHELPPAELRDQWLAWSQIASGLAVMLLSMLAVARHRWAPWAAAAVGFWIMMAPLVLWTSSAAAYAVDTLLGMLVIVLAVMVPPTPGISRAAQVSPADLPLGWTYSPSSAVQRIPIVALALIGLLVSRYLAAFQLGHIDSVWDPFFAGIDGKSNGTDAVITSLVSQSFPIPDAGLGAVAYALDMLTGAIGDRRRWRTMPWLVLVFGLLIIPLGLVSVAFIIIQPTVIGALCTLCLAQAVLTMAMVPYSIDEVLATVQYLMQSRRAGRSLWRTLLFGGPPLRERSEKPLPLESFWQIGRDFLRGGVTFPWTLCAACAIGVYLIAAPLVTGNQPPLVHSDHILGCVIITVAVTAMAEVARAARFALLPLGLWVAASPFVLDGGGGTAMAINLVLGLGLALLSLPRGTLSGEHYGGWDRAIV